MTEKTYREPDTGSRRLDATIMESVGIAMMAIYGENLPIDYRLCTVGKKKSTTYKGIRATRTEVAVEATVEAWGREHVFKTTVPVINEIKDGYYCPDEFFGAYSQEAAFLVWSNAGVYDMSTTIVGQAIGDSEHTSFVRWYVGDAMECEATFRCKFEELPQWVRTIILNDKKAHELRYRCVEKLA